MGAPEDDERAREFLAACGMPAKAVDGVVESAHAAVAEFGAAIVQVRLDAGEGSADVIPSEPSVRLDANGANGGPGGSRMNAIHRVST